MADYSGVYADFYELTMAQAYFLNGMEQDEGVFDYFFRKAPFGSSYAVFAGLEQLIDILEEFSFSADDISFLAEQGLDSKFLEYLREFKFQGNVFSCQEGEIVFPGMPILQVEGGLLEAQIVETLLLNILNFQTLIATKARRTRCVAPKALLSDFGMRRAQGLASLAAARACFIGGFDSTSNTKAGELFGIPVAGTMAHSFVQSFDEEIDAFRAFAKARPKHTYLLVDTYDTLRSGVPNAIKVAKEMRAKGDELKGVRLDSGDLSYLAKETRRMLDEAGHKKVKIAASNELDEHVVKSLLEQEAPIDFFGVGTKLVTGKPDAALDGVYKLSYSSGRPRLKLSETLSKISLPHKKQVYRLLEADGNFYGADAVALRDEGMPKEIFHPHEPLKSLRIEERTMEPLLSEVMVRGKRIAPERSLKDIKDFCAKRAKLLPPEFLRFENAQEYKVGISSELKSERDKLVARYRKRKEE